MKNTNLAILLACCVGCAKVPSPGKEETTMQVKRTDDRVWIEGVEGFNPGEYATSPHGCQARILQALGERMSYDDLVCYGGFAFRIGVHEGRSMR